MKIAAYVLVGFLLLLQYPLWLGDGGALAVWRLKGDIAAQQEENARLTERNLVLEAEVNDLKQGLAAIEERARSELGMVKPGETFYQVIDPKPEKQAGAKKRTTRQPASADTLSNKSKTPAEKPRTPAP